MHKWHMGSVFQLIQKLDRRLRLHVVRMILDLSSKLHLQWITVEKEIESFELSPKNPGHLERD